MSPFGARRCINFLFRRKAPFQVLHVSIIPASTRHVQRMGGDPCCPLTPCQEGNACAAKSTLSESYNGLTRSHYWIDCNTEKLSVFLTPIVIRRHDSGGNINFWRCISLRNKVRPIRRIENRGGSARPLPGWLSTRQIKPAALQFPLRCTITGLE